MLTTMKKIFVGSEEKIDQHVDKFANQIDQEYDKMKSATKSNLTHGGI